MSDPPKRSCGECYACCVWLGIEELYKWPGRACQHLSGVNPCGRCTIYEKRPAACSEYSCGWRWGLLADEDRPDKSGVLMTVYKATEEFPVTATIVVVDHVKAGAFGDPGSPLQRATRLLVERGIELVRIVDYTHKTVILLDKGVIYQAVLHRSEKLGYETLSYDQGNKVGTYHFEDVKSDAKA